jgi:AsmA family protein
MRNLRTSWRLAWFGIPLILLIALVAFWNWDWFIPIVQRRASAAIGRPVTIAHLHVRLGRVISVTLDGVVVANPPDWPSGDPPLASIKSLTVQADAWGYVRGNGLVLPVIEIDGPRVLLAETKDGAANFRLSTGGGSSGSVKIGAVRITDGDAHVVIPPLKSDFNAKIETQGDGDAAKLVVDAKGTYAAQPITAHLVGGALLSLRDAKNPCRWSSPSRMGRRTSASTARCKIRLRSRAQTSA